MPKTITIIGGGIAGGLSAILLQKILNDLYKAGCLKEPIQVTLYEKNPIGIINHTSLMPARQHLGGEYPLDSDTGLKCLQGAMVLKQMMPSWIYTEEQPITYLISSKTHKEGLSKAPKTLTVEDYINAYRKIQHQYQQYLNRAQEEYKQTPGKLLSYNEIEDIFFGSPESLITPLTPKDPPFKETLSGYFAGGMKSKEIGFNPAYMGITVEKMLQASGVTVHSGYEITHAIYNNPGYKLSVKDTRTNKIQDIQSDYVINAAWDNAFTLEKNIDTNTNGKIADIFLRGMIILDISQMEIKPTPIFSLLGEAGGMYSPFNDKIAFLCYLSEKCTYIDQCEITTTQRNTPQYWNDWIKGNLPDKDERMKIGFEAQLKKFPFLEGAKPIDLLVRPTISFDNQDLSKRRYQNIQEIQNGWFRNIPTKGTYAGIAAIETLLNIINSLSKENLITLQAAEKHIGFSLDTPIEHIPVLLPDSLKLTSLLDNIIDITKIKDFAKSRNLPQDIIFKTTNYISKFTERSTLSTPYVDQLYNPSSFTSRGRH